MILFLLFRRFDYSIVNLTLNSLVDFNLIYLISRKGTKGFLLIAPIIFS